MGSTFENYSSYYAFEDAKQTLDVLAKNNIEYKIEENFKNSLGEFYVGADVSPKYVLKLKSIDFKAATEILSIIPNVNNLDHYLNDYSTEELKTILLEYDKWHPNDVAYAEALLNERGVNYSESDLGKIKQERINELSQPKEADGYFIFVLFLTTAIGGFLIVFLMLLPIAYAINYYYLKKTLPNGEKVYVYNEITRKRGLYLLGFSIITSVIWISFILGLYL